MAIVNTNERPENEVWLHDVLMQIETDGHFAVFRGHIGLRAAGAAKVVWPALKAHHTLADGSLDAAQAGRDSLAFPPTMAVMARIGGRDRGQGRTSG